MNRERIAFYFEYVSDLVFSIAFSILGIYWMDTGTTVLKIVGFLIFIFFGVMYFQQSVTAIITGKRPNKQ